MGERDLKDEVRTHIIVTIAIAITMTITINMAITITITIIIVSCSVLLLWPKFDSARCLKHMSQSLTGERSKLGFRA